MGKPMIISDSPFNQAKKGAKMVYYVLLSYVDLQKCTWAREKDNYNLTSTFQ